MRTAQIIKSDFVWQYINHPAADRLLHEQSAIPLKRRNSSHLRTIANVARLRIKAKNITEVRHLYGNFTAAMQTKYSELACSEAIYGAVAWNRVATLLSNGEVCKALNKVALSIFRYLSAKNLGFRGESATNSRWIKRWAQCSYLPPQSFGLTKSCEPDEPMGFKLA